MTKIREGEFRVSVRSEEDSEHQKIRNEIAVLTAKRNRALAKFGEMALSELKDHPDFAGQAEEIEGYIEELRVLTEKENAL